MKLIKHLWQRIFAWTLFLVLLSNLVSFAVFHLVLGKDRNLEFSGYFMSGIAQTLAGQERESAELLLSFLNKPGTNRFWITDSDNNLLAGEPAADYFPEPGAGLESVKQHGDLSVLQFAGLAPLMQAPLELGSGPAVINQVVGFTRSRPLTPF